MADRVALTGSTGFVGRAALSSLRRAGHSPRLLVRSAAARSMPSSPTEVIVGDVRDAAARAALVRDAEVVLHLAAVVDPALMADSDLVDAVNHVAAAALARDARDAGVRRFVLLSSVAAMGFFSGRATPGSECQPVSAYGRSKLAAERAVLALTRADFEVIVLRPPTVYGPGERYNFLRWVRAVDQGLYRRIGAGDNVLPLCTADNCARAVVAAAEGRVPGGVHLTADREPYPVRRIHAAICAALGRAPPRLGLPLPLARAVARLNDAAHALSPRVPLVLGRGRLRTLTVDQPFDVTSLLDAGVELDAPLEHEVARTVAEQRQHGLLARSRPAP